MKTRRTVSGPDPADPQPEILCRALQHISFGHTAICSDGRPAITTWYSIVADRAAKTQPHRRHRNPLSVR